MSRATVASLMTIGTATRARTPGVAMAVVVVVVVVAAVVAVALLPVVVSLLPVVVAMLLAVLVMVATVLLPATVALLLAVVPVVAVLMVVVVAMPLLAVTTAVERCRRTDRAQCATRDAEITLAAPGCGMSRTYCISWKSPPGPTWVGTSLELTMSPRHRGLDEIAPWKTRVVRLLQQLASMVLT